MATPSVPQHHPTPRELDDLELLVSGAVRPTVGYNEPGSPVTLDLPTELADHVAAGGKVELVDPEGLPLAVVTAAGDGWAVEPLTHAQHGPFRRLYLPPAQVRQQYAGRTFVPVTDLVTDAQREQLRGLGPVVLLALVGTGTPAVSPVGLLRATLRSTEGLDAAVVAVPLAGHGDPTADRSLREAVLANYAETDPVVELVDGGEVLPELADIVEQERPPRDRQGLVLFFTGLSGSGKSTLARALMDRLLEKGGRTLTSLDGDVVRRNLSAGLTFSKEDRETNIRRIGWVAAEIARHGGVAVCSPIAPFDATRKQVRQYVEDAGGAFFLVHVATPLEECERRDRKGLYAKARRGEIPEFTGISSPYEEPEDADVRVDTTGRTIEDALDHVVVALKKAGYLDLTEPVDALGGRAEASAGKQRVEIPEVTDRVADATGRGPETLDRPLRVLFVCTANVCRSPYMELRSQALLAEANGGVSRLEFASAGTHGFDANPMDPTMAGALIDRGITGPGVEDFLSRRLTRDMVNTADLVLTADASHRQFVLEEAPATFRKVFTLGQFAESIARLNDEFTGAALVAAAGQQRAGASPGHDVADPYNRGRQAAEQVADQIDALLCLILPRLGDSGMISAGTAGYAGHSVDGRRRSGV